VAYGIIIRALGQDEFNMKENEIKYSVEHWKNKFAFVDFFLLISKKEKRLNQNLLNQEP